MAMSRGKVNATELTAALINQKDNLVEGILHAQDVIKGSMTILILTDQGEIIAARDRWAVCLCWWARMIWDTACPLNPLPITSWAMIMLMSLDRRNCRGHAGQL